MSRCWRRVDLGNLIFLISLAVLLLSCQGEEAAPPAVEYAGCWEVSLPGPVCTRWPMAAPPLKLWVKAEPGEKVEIRAGDQILAAAGEQVQGGWRYVFEIPQHASSITVSLLSVDGRRGPVWSLRLADTPAWQMEIVELESRGRSGEIAAKLADLRATVSPSERGLVYRALAWQARDSDEYENLVQRGIDTDRAKQNLRGESEKIGWLARLYLEQGRFSEARKILKSVEIRPEAPAEARYWIAFYQGVLAQRVGDYRTALESMREAIRLAERGGMDRFRWYAEQALANIYRDLGESKDASELFTRLRAEPHYDRKSPCDLPDLLTNQAWFQLLACQGGEDFGDPTPTLEEARALYDNGCQASQRLNARLNLALAHLQGKRPELARRVFEEARLFDAVRLEERLWRLDIEGRILIAEGRPEPALRLYDELAETAEEYLSLDGRFRALLGRAQAQHALDRRAEAIDSLAEAEDVLDHQIWRIPVHEGRDTFLAQRGIESTRRLLDLLLADKQTRRAFEVARRSRSRLLRQLVVKDRLARLSGEEQVKWDQALSGYLTLRNEIDRQLAEKWQIPKTEQKTAADRWSSQLAQAQRALDRAVSDLGSLASDSRRELSPPGPGEVILAYHPLPQGWVGFAAGESGIEVRRFETLPPRTQLLSAPFGAMIRAADRVRVLPYGPLWDVDFAALPFDGQPLLARRAVVYSLDLPPPPPFRTAGPLVALLVADPRSDLPAARKEAEGLAGTFRGWGSGWSLKRLDSLDATAGAVRASLPATHLFHYAGHGLFSGDAGWGSALELADDSTLTVGDILTLPRVPEWVVLSACEGGASSERAPGTGIGLAPAFLVAGSLGVVAAHRPVPDSTARELMRELYREWRPGADLARELRRTQLAYLQRHPTSDDWASFRLLTP